MENPIIKHFHINIFSYNEEEILVFLGLLIKHFVISS